MTHLLVMAPKRDLVEIFVNPDGVTPFTVWFHDLKNSSMAALVLCAIEELREGTFENCRSIGCGVFEQRISVFPPLRLFFALVGPDGLLLLTGCSDPSKKDSSELAMKIWKEFKSHAH